MGDILYLNIVASIKQDILKGIYNPGDILASEAVLMKKFNTTKITIRRSLSLLANEGYIYSVPGKGNFVCLPDVDKYELRFNKHDRLNVQIDSIKLSTVNILELTEAPGVFLKLRLDENDKVIEVIRILISSDKPVAYEKIYSLYVQHSPVVENLLNFANCVDPTDNRNAFIIQKQLRLDAMLSDEEQAAILEIKHGDVVFRLDETVSYTDSDKIVTFSQYFIRPKYINLSAYMSFQKDDKYKGIY